MAFDEFQSLFPQRISRSAHKGDFGAWVGFAVAHAHYSFTAIRVTRRNDFTGTERVVTGFFFLTTDQY